MVTTDFSGMENLVVFEGYLCFQQITDPGHLSKGTSVLRAVSQTIAFPLSAGVECKFYVA